MANHIKQENKIKPNIHFKLRLEIPFCAGVKPDLCDEFRTKTYNENLDDSKVLRKIIFNRVNFNNEQDFSKIKGMKEVIIQARELIYKHLGASAEKKFSKIITEEIESYLKEKK